MKALASNEQPPRPLRPEDGMTSLRSAAARRWIALVVLCVGQLMIVLDVDGGERRPPVDPDGLHTDQASLAWVINGYLISFGGLLLLAGRLGDLLGRRRLFLTGIAIFTIASALCGLAPSEGLLTAARFVQGVGAAIVSSMVLGILVTLFKSREQTARAMSIYAFVASAGGSIGLLVGGVLTQALSWHWIFFINLPIGVAAFVLGAILIPEHTRRGSPRRRGCLGRRPHHGGAGTGRLRDPRGEQQRLDVGFRRSAWAPSPQR